MEKGAFLHTYGTPDAGLSGYPVPIQDIERQIRWEMANVEEGVRRYRRSIAEADLGDTPPGVIAMRDMMAGLVPAIEAARQEAIDGIVSEGKGRKPEWWWTIGFLSAEKLAVITARALLTDRKQRTGGSLMSAVAINIGSSVKMEMEYEQWRIREARRAKEDPNHINLFRLITSRAKKVDAKAFLRWRKKLSSIERLDWTREMKLQLGSKLLDLAIRHGGGWFEYRMIYARGKSERRVFLTDVARTAINDVNARLEVNRPYHLPMKVPPKPWRRDENRG
jgi:hypothetical protein